jgi:hypothetical protein
LGLQSWAGLHDKQHQTFTNPRRLWRQNQNQLNQWCGSNGPQRAKGDYGILGKRALGCVSQAGSVWTRACNFQIDIEGAERNVGLLKEQETETMGTQRRECS